MGQFKFQVANPDTIGDSRLKHIYAVDAMLVSFAVNASIENDVVVINLPCDESCQLFFPWPMLRGDLMLCTTSLRLSDLPYEYELELARGTVGRLLAKFSFWQEPGIEFSETLIKLVSQCQTKLIEAVFEKDPLDRSDAARAAIELAIESMQLLVEEYVSQVSPDAVRVPVSFGVVYGPSESNDASSSAESEEDLSATETAVLKLDDTKRLSKTNADRSNATSDLTGQLDTLFLPAPNLQLDANISQELLQVASQTQKLFKEFDVPQLRAAESQNSAVTLGIGPIMDWHSAAIEQLLGLEMDFEEMRENLYTLSKAIVENLPKPVNAFYVAAGVGAHGIKKFNDHQRLQLTLDAMCGIYKSAPNMPLLVSFHQPIGCEIDNAPLAISPLHGADALMRADAGLQMIGLEISFADDDYPSTRELLQLNELVDVWSEFGLPLFVVIKLAPVFVQPTMRMPGKETQQTESCLRDGLRSAPAAVQHRESAKPEFDYCELRRIVSLLRSKPAVHSLFFSSPDVRAELKTAATSPGQLPFEEIVLRVIAESKSSKI